MLDGSLLELFISGILLTMRTNMHACIYICTYVTVCMFIYFHRYAWIKGGRESERKKRGVEEKRRKTEYKEIE